MDSVGPSQSEIEDAHLRGVALGVMEFARLASAAVAESAVREPWPILSDRVVFREGGLFDFCHQGIPDDSVPVFTIAVFGLAGITDIAAWEPASNRLALWLGRGFALGETEIWAPRLKGEILSIWRSPWGWLRSGRQGVVILRPRAAPFYLDHLPAVLAEDLDHGEDLEKVLRPPQPRTKIFIRREIAQPNRSAA
jgi:hypothetical protein